MVEGLDDISISGQEKITLDQLKHHTKAVTLTDASPELWKTLRVWSASLAEGRWKPAEVQLNLVTTAQVGDGSAAALLRKNGRNETKALEQLRKVAQERGNSGLTSAHDAFEKLHASQQQLLINAITVVDAADNIEEIVPKIKIKLRFSTAREHVDALYERLEGWLRWSDLDGHV